MLKGATERALSCLLQARRVAKTFSQPPDMKCGTIMAVCFMKSLKGQLQILGGYEDGSVALWSCTDANKPLAVVKCHSECIIALDACGSGTKAVPNVVRPLQSSRLRAALVSASAFPTAQSCCSCLTQPSVAK